MNIPTTPVHQTVFTDPGAWASSDLGAPAGLATQLPDAVLDELDQALASVRKESKRLADLTSDTFRLPSLTDFAQSLRQDLLSGRGLALLRGLPMERYTRDEAAMLYWGIGATLGPTIPQNAKGERLYSVRDEGYRIAKDYGATGVRYSKTTESFNFHTDSAPILTTATPDVIGLFAMHTAKSGGETLLVSGKTAHNFLLAERPDSLGQLYGSFHHDRTAEWQPGQARTLEAPVLRFDTDLEMRYMRFYIEQGHQKAAAPLSHEQVAAFDSLDAVMNRAELQLRFAMEAGDILLLNNHFVLHSRTAFEDYPEIDRRRHYARMWMKVPAASTGT